MRRIYDQYARLASVATPSGHDRPPGAPTREPPRSPGRTIPTFDYALGRVRILAGVVSLDERWGVLADGVKKEAEAYSSPEADPGRAGRSDLRPRRRRLLPGAPGAVLPRLARSRGRGPAVSCPGRHRAARRPAAAAAWRLALDLMEAGDARQPLYPKVREFASSTGSDPRPRRWRNRLFAKDLIEAHWPIAVGRRRPRRQAGLPRPVPRQASPDRLLGDLVRTLPAGAAGPAGGLRQVPRPRPGDPLDLLRLPAEPLRQRSTAPGSPRAA